MPGCSAIGCNNRSEKGYMMKCFPRDPVLRQVWKKRVGRSDWEPSNNSFLCHMHFEPNEWIVTNSGRVKLKKGALPSIFNVMSTRKSSKKRSISDSENGYNTNDYLIEYLQSDLPSLFNQSGMVSMPEAVRDSSPSVNSGQIHMITKQEDDDEKIIIESNCVVVNGQKQDDIVNNVNTNLFKMEMNNENDVRFLEDHMQLEKRLELICDGKKYEDLNKYESFMNCVENLETDDIKKTFPESDSDSDFDNKNSKPNIMATSCDIVNSNENVQSTFTIKVSGEPDDVFEILKNFNSSANDTKQSDIEYNGKKFITSEIIVNCTKADSKQVMDHFNDDQDSLQSDSMTFQQDSTSPDFLFVNELLQKCKDLEAKVGMQQQLINTLSEQSINHKDFTDSIKLMEAEMKRKDTEIQQLKRRRTIKKGFSNNKRSNNKVSSQAEVEEPLLFKITNKVNQLETTNKQLMRSLNVEVEKRRKAEYQVKDRENKIKELKWKLEKASKFYERSEKNTNTYRRKLSTLQTLLRRRNMLDDKKRIYKELAATDKSSFSKRSLTAAASILKSCGHRGYSKLLAYNFPLPPVNLLLPKDDNISKKMTLESEQTICDKSNVFELASGTVQDIFNESSDGDYTLDINEFKKYITTEDNTVQQNVTLSTT